MKKIVLFVIIAVLGLGSFFLYQFVSFTDGRLHIIFCDVGQGDAILIKTPNKKTILVDGGPDKKVLDCLSRHLPFWQRNIDVLLLTHPHADHFMGMYYVLERYRITLFATEKLTNKTAAFEEFMRMLGDKHISQKTIGAGDKWRIGVVTISIAAPTNEFLQKTSPGGTIGESGEFASVITHISYRDFSALLTGDSQARELTTVADMIGSTVDVLQSPHHGSKTGLDEQVLAMLAPKLAVISVGKNRYGHPAKQVLDLLHEQEIKMLRTDQAGDVEIISDGKTWQVR